MKKNFCDRCEEEITLDGFIDGKTKRFAHGFLKDKSKAINILYTVQRITDIKTTSTEPIKIINLDLCYSCSSDIFTFAHLEDSKEPEKINDILLKALKNCVNYYGFLIVHDDTDDKHDLLIEEARQAIAKAEEKKENKNVK